MIRYLKLTGGEEVLGEVDAEESGYDALCIDGPVRLLLTNKGYALVPYPTDRVTINKMHVLFDGDANAVVAKDYEQMRADFKRCATGLAVPNGGLSLPGR